MTDLEKLAKWHKDDADGYTRLIAEHFERWPDEGEPRRYTSARNYHTAAAATIRAAMAEIERLNVENAELFMLAHS